MEQLNHAVGNPTSLLIERLFWLGLGGFLGLAIINSLIRGLNEKTPIQKLFLKKIKESQEKGDSEKR